MIQSNRILAAAIYAGTLTLPVAAAPSSVEHKATPMALSDEHVAKLQRSLSDSRQVFTQRGGAEIFQAVCQGCHMPDGQGAKGAGFYPALAQNPKLASNVYPAIVVMNGLHGMPGFSNRLTNEQVAEVVNYLRSSFGNRYTDEIKADDVQPFRK